MYVLQVAGPEELISIIEAVEAVEAVGAVAVEVVEVVAVEVEVKRRKSVTASPDQEINNLNSSTSTFINFIYKQNLQVGKDICAASSLLRLC